MVIIGIVSAARMGDQGKGFNVVAHEMSKLGNASMKSAKNIGKLIADIKYYTEKMVHVMEKTGQVLEEQEEAVTDTEKSFLDINYQVDRLVQSIDKVAKNTLEMKTTKEEALTAVRNISGMSQETVVAIDAINRNMEIQIEGVRSLDDLSSQLGGYTDTLNEIISQFKC